MQTVQALAHDFGKYTDAPGAYEDKKTGNAVPYIRLLRHKITGSGNIPEDIDYPAQADVLDDEGKGWWRFCLSIALEHGPNAYPKHRFAFFLKIRIENGHVYTQLLDRSYQDFDVNTDGGKEMLFKHMIEMLHIAFQCPPRQGLLEQQFGVFHMSLEHERYPHTQIDARP
jgi:hypothetical protein